jgi:hypothetical protein
MVKRAVLALNAFLLLCLALPTQAQPSVSVKPLTLPVSLPPSPQTWLLGQPYGNTIGAFLRGDDWYRAGQRLHFGIDLSMPCGTPLIAAADGTVAFVDDLGFGSGPHNAILRHPQLGITTLYGHLRERPPLTPGQPIRQGDLVGYSGDPDITCDSRPHLHFEVRALDYFTAYNPVDYIDANWHALAAIGAFRYPQFQQNLDDARRWMSIDDQPPVAFGGRALNNYAAPYPDPRSSQPPPNPPLARDLPTIDQTPAVRLRRLAFDGCCHGAWWDAAQPDTIYTIDGTTGQRAVILSWDTARDDGGMRLIGNAPPPWTTADGSHEIRMDGVRALIRRTADDQVWVVETGGAVPSASANNRYLMWQVNRPERAELWISDLDGANLRQFSADPGLSVQWLDGARLLLAARRVQTTSLYVFNVETNETFELGSWERLRSLSIAPGGGRIAFYTAFQGESSGVYTIKTIRGATAQRHDWFGAWLWRDQDTLFYLPLDVTASNHTLHYYNVRTSEDRVIIDPNTTRFLVANGDWSLSPDGDQIAFLNALDMTLWTIHVG